MEAGGTQSRAHTENISKKTNFSNAEEEEVLTMYHQGEVTAAAVAHEHPRTHTLHEADDYLESLLPQKRDTIADVNMNV